jgi:hypothetical protein
MTDPSVFCIITSTRRRAEGEGRTDGMMMARLLDLVLEHVDVDDKRT